MSFQARFKGFKHKHSSKKKEKKIQNSVAWEGKGVSAEVLSSYVWHREEDNETEKTLLIG